VAAYVIVTHPVKDFDVWKIVFDEFEQLRKEAGELTAVVLRHVDDPNIVTVLNTWTSIDAAKAFVASEEIKKGMGEAGVTAPSTFVFANSE
jgi:quinol monooxygenase YgiN